jgi:hypothetical protein
MKTRVGGALVAAASAVALMGVPAFAATAGGHGGPRTGGGQTTSGAGSVLGGNQVNVPISVPINVCGNAIAILGIAEAGCQGGAAVLGNLLGGL